MKLVRACVGYLTNEWFDIYENIHNNKDFDQYLKKIFDLNLPVDLFYEKEYFMEFNN